LIIQSGQIATKVSKIWVKQQQQNTPTH
jgi:hypothetical protein